MVERNKLQPGICNYESWALKKAKAKKNRHPGFQSPHGRWYWRDSNELSFGERTGSGDFHVEVADSAAFGRSGF